jgi:hypothetical protein
MPTGALLPPVTVNGVTYRPTINGAIAGGGNAAKTFTVNSDPTPGPYTGAGPYALNTFWMLATDNPQFTAVPSNAAYANYPTLVTCKGFDSNAAWTLTNFRDCVGVPKTANGSQIYTQAMHAQNTGLVGGYIKIEIQKPDYSWVDVTAEILNYGIAGPSQWPGNNCYNLANPNPKAILRVQRVRDTPGSCTAGGSQDSYDYWPNVLFDTREGLLRDVDPNDGRPTLGGLMNYIELDVQNLSLWFKCARRQRCSQRQPGHHEQRLAASTDRRGNVNPGRFHPANRRTWSERANTGSRTSSPEHAAGTPLHDARRRRRQRQRPA